MIRWSTRCVVFLLIGILAPSSLFADTRTTQGNSSGEGVSPFWGALASPTANLFSGAMGTSIPIQVPPGRKNLTPDLQLVYSSDAGQTPFGFGWDVPLGRIERNTRYGAPSCALHTEEFVLSLDGSAIELVRIGNPGATDYRARIDEAYLEAKAVPGANQWEVRDRAGNTYRFGVTANDRAFTGSASTFFSASPCNFTSVWVLNQIEDPNGNRIDISYFKDENVFYPSTISYGGNKDLLGAQHPFRVQFSRRAAPRPHPGTSYRRGVREAARYVIERIDVQTSENGSSFSTLRSLFLDFEEVEENGRTLLATVSGTLLPTRSFTYSTSEFEHVAMAAPSVSPASSVLPPLRYTEVVGGVHNGIHSVMDMNGDGFQDLVHGTQASNWTVFLGSATGFRRVSWKVDSAVTGARIRGTLVAADGSSQTMIDTADLDGDGIADLIDANPQSSGPCAGGWWVRAGRELHQGEFEYEFGPAECWLGAGPVTASSATARTAAVPAAYAGTHFITTRELVDINGDGRLDIVDGPAGGADAWTVRVNSAGSICGAPEARCFIHDPSYVAAGPIRDTFVFYSPQAFTVVARINIVDLIDINGDGLVDRISTQARDGRPDFDVQPIGAAGAPAALAIPSSLIFCTHYNYYIVNWCMNPPPSGVGYAGIAYVELNTGRQLVAADSQFMKAADLSRTLEFLGTRTQQRLGDLQTWTTLEDFADLNADGLPERIWHRDAGQEIRVQRNQNGSLEGLLLDGGEVFYVARPRPWPGLQDATRVESGNATIRDLFDVDGDGFLDRVDTTGGVWSVQRGGPRAGEPQAPPSLLTRIDDGVGGITEVRYAPSTTIGANPRLPFAKWVVAKIRRTDGLCDAPSDGFDPSNPCIAQGHEIQKFLTYEGGRFDGPTREFRGFETVAERDTQGNARIVTFSQDEHTRGKILAEVVETATGVEVKRVEYDWEARLASDGRVQIHLGESRVVEPALGAAGASDWCVVNRNEAPDSFGRVSRSCTLDCDGAASVQGCGTDPIAGEVVTETLWADPAPPSQVRERPWQIRIRYGDVTGTPRLLSEKNFAYDEQGFGQPVSEGNLTTTQTRLDQSHADVNWPTSTSEYDTYGNVVSTRDPNAVAYGDAATTTLFDDWKLYPETVTRPPAGGTTLVTTSEWDRGLGKATRIVDPNQQETAFLYDALGRPICEARPGDDCSTETSPASARYDYALGTPGAPTLEGRLSYIEVRTREPNAPSGYLVSRRYFDALGRPRFSTGQTVVGSNPALQDVIEGQTDYTPFGKPARVFDLYARPASGVVESPPGVASTAVTYWLDPAETVVDPLGRVHRTTPPDGRHVRTFYEGSRVRTLDVDDNEVSITRNHLGHEVLEERTGADATSMRFDREFDGMGRLLQVQISNTATTTISHAYDTLGRLRETVDPDSGLWRYGYDPNGNLIFRDDPKSNQHLEWSFDAIGRITARCAFTGDAFVGNCAPGISGVDSAFEYDSVANGNYGLGRLTRVTETVAGVVEGVEESTYDFRGRVENSSRTIKGKTLVMGFEYDEADHPTTIRYPSGQAAGEPVVHTYDAAGRLQSLVGARTYASVIRYDLRGRMYQLAHGNGIVDWSEFYGPEENHRLRAMRTVSSTVVQQVFTDLEYLYDDVGKIGEIRDHDDGVQAALSNDAVYDYDGLGRLRHVDWAGIGDESFDYDAIGNLAGKDGVTFQYSPTQPHRVIAAGATNYLFDANGSQSVRYPGGTAQQLYAYDRVGRLVTIGDGTSTTQFRYDHTDRRVSKTRQDGTTIRYWGRYAESRGGRLIKYYWAGDRMIASLDVPAAAYSEAPPGTPNPTPPWLPMLLLGIFGGVVVSMAWTPRGSEVRVGVAVAPARALATSSLLLLTSTPLLLAPQCSNDPVLRHFHLDHLGSVVAKSNDVGGLVSQVRYRAYGDERGHFSAGGGAIPATAADRHEWTGYEAEHEAGLAYAGARYYDPAIGQFLSHDPVRQYASPYAYGPGDPVNGTDPNGMLFGFLKDLYKGIKKALGAAGDAMDRALPSNVSLSVTIGYTHRFGEQGTASQEGAGRANPGDAILRGYVVYGASSRYAVYAAVVAMTNGQSAAGAPAIYTQQVLEAATSGQTSQIADDQSIAIRKGDRIPGLFEYRDEFSLFGENGKRYGHYWKESDPDGRSWGWWPNQRASDIEAILGVAGELNQGHPNDPDAGVYINAQRYDMYATRDFESRAAVIGAIESFASSYRGQWRLSGPNCHTFQRDLDRAVGLRPVRSEGWR